MYDIGYITVKGPMEGQILLEYFCMYKVGGGYVVQSKYVARHHEDICYHAQV